MTDTQTPATDRTMARTDALNTIQTLIQTYDFQISDILPLFNAPLESSISGDTKPAQVSIFQKLMAYLGGTFIVMGLAAYIAMEWDTLDSLSRVLITLGSGFIAFFIGLLSFNDPRFGKVSTPLITLAAVLEPTGLFVFLYEYIPPTGSILQAYYAVFGALTLQYLLCFVATRRTSLLFFGVFFYWNFIGGLIEDVYGITPNAFLALGLIGLTISWGLSSSRHAVIAPFYFLCASSITAIGAFIRFADTSYDVLIAAVSAGLIYLATLTNSRTTLFVGVTSLLVFLGYYTEKYFKDIVGWPIALILLGFIMIGISAYAFKLGKKMGKTA